MYSRSAIGGVAILSALVLLAACGSSVSGSAVPSTVVAVATEPTGTRSSPTGHITEPGVPLEPAGSGTTTPPAGSAGVAASRSSAAGVVPAGLEQFYGQRLAWAGCSSYATSADAAAVYPNTSLQCARLTVPLAYSNPTGPTVTMAVLRKVATDPSSRIGSLVVDPGGPGASGMIFLAQVATPNPAVAPTSQSKNVAALNAKFDLVGIDPRGVGSSVPAVQCQTDAEQDRARTVDQRSRTQADVDAANSATRQKVSECVVNTGKATGIDGKTFLANIGTRDVAEDLDVLRSVLGDAKLSYLGFSYGTQIGWEYAEQFPANIRAILFDGDINPDEDPATADTASYKSFQNAFDAFASWCAQSSPGCVLGTDTSRSLEKYQALVRPLLTKQLSLRDGRTMSFTDAVTGTYYSLYATVLRPVLAKGLLDLTGGDGSTLMALADQYDGRDADGHYQNESQAFDAVRCVDGPSLTDPAAVMQHNAANIAAAPFETTGDPPGAILDTCAVWPVPPTLQPHVLKIAGLPKTLVISTTGDPATPYSNGVELAKEIGATLLTAVGVRHSSYLLSDVTCVDEIGSAYLLTLELPAVGTTCR